MTIVHLDPSLEGYRFPEEFIPDMHACNDWQEFRQAVQQLWIGINTWCAATAKLQGCDISDAKFRSFKDSLTDLIDDLTHDNEVELTKRAMDGDDYYAATINHDLANDLLRIDPDKGAEWKHHIGDVFSLRWKIHAAKYKYAQHDIERAIRVIEKHAETIGRYDYGSVSASLFRQVEESLKLNDGQLMKWIACIELHNNACKRQETTMRKMANQLDMITGGNA